MFSSDIKPSVFVSAVSADLRTVRDVASRVLNTLGCLPVEQERFPTNAYVDVRQMLERKLRSCQAVVHIAGLRYGREPDPATLPPGAPRRSYTQMEFDLARQLKKPVYVFICGEGFPYDPARPGLDPSEEPAELCELQQSHRAALVAQGGIYHNVATRDDVAQRVGELETRLDALRQQLVRGRMMMIAAAIMLAVGIAGLGYQQTHTRRDVAQARQEVAGVAADAAASRRLLEQLVKNQGEMNSLSQDGQGAARSSIRDLSDDEYYGELARRAKTTPELVKSALAQLQNVQDLSIRANVALVERRFADAERLFGEAKQERLRQLSPAIVAVAEDEQGQAKAAYYRQDYARALELLASAIRRIEELPAGRSAALQLWGSLQYWTGLAESYSLAGLKGTELLEAAERAVTACRKALDVYTREMLPQEWADTQNSLGGALWLKSQLLFGPRQAKVLAEAVAAYRSALEVRTREALPQGWAWTQSNLGLALADQARAAPRSERVELLAEAISAYRKALEVITRETLPQDWAAVQNNLGIALKLESEFLSGPERAKLLTDAVAAYHDALVIRTRELLPMEWARTQVNLGVALVKRAEFVSGIERAKLLAGAVAAYRDAVKVLTRDARPRDWAMTQSKLGIALAGQQELVSGLERAKLLAEAIDAFRNAFEIYTHETLPEDWAETEYNLGLVLAERATLASGPERVTLFSEAAEAYQKAIEVFNREPQSRECGLAHLHLGTTLRDLASMASGPQRAKLLAEAIASYRGALEALTREVAPQEWASTEENLGNSLSVLAALVAGSERTTLLAEAVASYRSALEVYTRESLPWNWANTQSYLALAIRDEATISEGERRVKSLREAISLFEEVAQAQISGIDQTKQKAFYALVVILTDMLGDTDQAEYVSRAWLKSHPNDLGAAANLAELLFLAARFDDSLAELEALHPKLAAAERTQLDLVRRSLQALVLTALDKPADARRQLQDLDSELSVQSDDFSFNWTWQAAKNFIERSADERVAKCRQRLLAIVEAIAQPTKKAILEKLAPLVE